MPDDQGQECVKVYPKGLKVGLPLSLGTDGEELSNHPVVNDLSLLDKGHRPELSRDPASDRLPALVDGEVIRVRTW